ncbi:MAG TPA: pyridoxamine 5'-phosphate oxidase family protein [Chloroflexota bacterium]|nr:pyridoxamine 5'-phosphate oxidase family protein [Chloroflexota bacterium]
MAATLDRTSEQATRIDDPFDNRFTRRHGVPNERPRKKVLPFMNEDVQAFIRRAPFAVLATSDAAGRCDASPRGGLPGFVRILDERRLLLPDVKGNRLFQSYLNVEQNGNVGLLFMLPGSDKTVRVNGRASVIEDDEVRRQIGELAIHNPDEDAVLLQGLLIQVEEAYSHCPRSFSFADLWNTETIQANRGPKRA